MAHIKDVKIGNNTYLIEPAVYAATAGTASAITAAVSNFALDTGVVVSLKITTANAANATLNVNGTGDKTIRYNNANIAASALKTNRFYSLLYDGSYWQLLGELDTNTWRGIQDNLTSSSNTTESLSAKQGYLLANGSARDDTKVEKTTYEYNREISFGSSGLLLIGKFPCYDSNVTIEIKSTTSITYYAVAILATQNINTTGGGTINWCTYGDTTNSVTANLYAKYVSGSRNIEIYFVPTKWSKNLIHIQAVALSSVPTNICESVTSKPDEATRQPTNTAINASYLVTGTVAIEHGGTNATSASGARTNLGLGTMATETATDYLKLSGGTMTGPLKWNGSNSLPEKTNPEYFLVIDAFANGGKTYWSGKADVKSTLLGINSTHNNQFLRKDGTWTTPPYPVTKVAGNTGDITADTLRTSLGLSNAMHFLGVTTTNISTGTANTTATVTIGSSNVTAAAGDVVLYGSQEYVWGNEKWNLLGDESSYKVKQTAKSDPTASTTTSTTFIDTISQDANGVITATKKTLPTASSSIAGITKVGASGGAAAYSHTHYQLTTIGDKRNENTTPNTYANHLIFQGLKTNSKIGNPYTDNYSYVVGLRGWSNSSGGNSHELAFNTNGIYRRQGATTDWGNWFHLLDSNNYTTYTVKKDGTGATGTWGISVTGTAANVTGTVAIEHGGTNATTAADARTNLGLGNVENTALSTWAGTSNITTVGTISTGTWQGTAIAASYIGSHSTDKLTSGTLPVARGGTGITTSTYKNAVLVGNSSTVTNAFHTIRTASGAFYATAQDGAPSFGTLPVAQGGTGQTSIANIKAGKDGDGNTISSTYLKKSGGTMTGDVTAPTFIGDLTGIASSSPKLTLQAGNVSSTSTDTYATNGLNIRWFSTADCIPGQPSQYGFLLTAAAADSSKETHQIFMVQADGSLYHRGTNASSYTSPPAFKTILDSANYTSYLSSTYLALSGGTMRGTIGFSFPNLDIETTPSSDTYYDLAPGDKNGKRVSLIRMGMFTDGYVYAKMMAIGSWSAGAKNNSLELKINSSGNAIVNINQPAAWRAALDLVAASGTLEGYGSTFKDNSSPVNTRITRFNNVVTFTICGFHTNSSGSAVQTSTNASIGLTIPNNFKPGKTVYMPVTGSNGTHYVLMILSTGAVNLSTLNGTIPANTWVYGSTSWIAGY